MPIYYVEEFNNKGNPYIKILKDRKEFGADIPGMKGFQFGLREAKLIVGTYDIIQKSHDTDVKFPESGNKYLHASDIYYSKEDSFEGIGGKIINQPYLRLEKDNIHIGFGLSKATALLIRESDIKKIVEKYS